MDNNKEWLLPEDTGYIDTNAEKIIRSIRKEIALDIKSGTDVQEARQKANLKYGKGWREKGLIQKQ